MELIPLAEFVAIAAGFTGGFLLVIIISFAYFFTADRRIVRTFQPGFTDFDENKKSGKSDETFAENNFGLPVGFYLTTRFRLIRQGRWGTTARSSWILYLNGIMFPR